MSALIGELIRVADGLPDAELAAAIEFLRTGAAGGKALAEWAAAVPQEEQRRRLARLASAWTTRSPELSGPELGAALAAAVAVRQSVPRPEIAWTGPAPAGHAYRSTQELLREMIESAEKSLLLVTYMVGDVSGLCAELEATLARGVSVWLIVEHFDAFKQTSKLSDLQKLGPAILAQASISIWPEARRWQVNGQTWGSLHVKCVVADEARVLFTSANWTQAAMTQNMEMGIAVADASVARRVSSHFGDLEAEGTLQRWRPGEAIAG